MNNSVVTRYAGNPILTADDIPFEANLIFNAGVIKHHGRYIMLFRDDFNYTKKMFDDWAAGKGELHGPSCQIGLAYSDDGFHWKPEPKPILNAEQASVFMGEPVAHAYDPRMTVIDDAELDNAGRVRYKGQLYEFKKDVTTILLMGVDSRSKEASEGEFGGSNQSDMNVLAVLDPETRQITLINISRDSMVEMEVLDAQGNSSGTAKAQLALAYSYGDGGS